MAAGDLDWIDEPDGRPLDQILQLARELVEDPEYPIVRRWREAGGKVIGHFQVYFPEEIAHAAGALPLKIHGAQVEAAQAESRARARSCSALSR